MSTLNLYAVAPTIVSVVILLAFLYSKVSNWSMRRAEARRLEAAKNEAISKAMVDALQHLHLIPQLVSNSASVAEKIGKLGSQAPALPDSLNQIPAMVAALVEIAKTQTQQLERFERVVRMLSECMFSKETKGYTPENSDAVARYERDYRIEEMIRAGIPEDQARSRIETEDVFGQFKVER
jgi:hypothetical protein